MFNQETIEKQLYKPMKYKKTFPKGDTFAAFYAATDFLKSKGYSVGSMQRHEPIGIAKGEAVISKWRNLGPDVRQLDGVLVSDSFREGDVTIYLNEPID